MEQNRMEKLTGWLEAHQEEMFEDIAGLVAIPTVVQEQEGGYPYGSALARAVLYMGELAEKYGFRWQNHDWHCVSISYGEGEGQLGIWGHLDIVPPGDDWIYQPYECKRIKNFLLGRGTQDNKGPGIASLYLLRYLKEQGICPGFEIRLIYGCQEETEMKDAAEYLKREKAPDYSFVPDCSFPVCYGEKGMLKLTLQSAPFTAPITVLSGGGAANIIPAKGKAVIGGRIYETEGIPGHCAYPEGKVNAFGELGHICMDDPLLSHWEREVFRFLAEGGSDGYGQGLGLDAQEEESGALTCSPTLLSLEEGRAQIVVHIRYPIAMDSETLIKKCKEKAETYGLSVIQTEDNQPNREDPKGPWAEFLTGIYEEVMGKRQEPYVMSGGTYARKVPRGVGFGPGLPKDMTVLQLPEGHGECHEPDEAQCIDTLFQAWKIYAHTILTLIETGFPVPETGKWR